MNDAPKLWDFRGWVSGHTQYDVRLIGNPSAKSLRQLITTLELYHQFLAEDEQQPSPADRSEAGHIQEKKLGSPSATGDGEDNG